MTTPAPPAISTRIATPTDVAELVPLIQSAYRGDASRAGWTTEADLLAGQRTDAAAVLDVITGPHSLMLLATAEPSTETAEGTGTADSGLLACCQLERREPGTAYFGMFAVRPHRQGAGVGRTLLAAAEAYAIDVWHAVAMEMTVIVQRADLIAWYERRGYLRTSRTLPFPYGDERFGVPRRADLEFVVLHKSLLSD